MTKLYNKLGIISIFALLTNASARPNSKSENSEPFDIGEALLHTSLLGRIDNNLYAGINAEYVLNKEDAKNELIFKFALTKIYENDNKNGYISLNGSLNLFKIIMNSQNQSFSINNKNFEILNNLFGGKRFGAEFTIGLGGIICSGIAMEFNVGYNLEKNKGVWGIKLPISFGKARFELVGVKNRLSFLDMITSDVAKECATCMLQVIIIDVILSSFDKRTNK